MARESPYSGVFYAVKILPSNLAILITFRVSTVSYLGTTVFGIPTQLAVT